MDTWSAVMLCGAVAGGVTYLAAHIAVARLRAKAARLRAALAVEEAAGDPPTGAPAPAEVMPAELTPELVRGWRDEPPTPERLRMIADAYADLVRRHRREVGILTLELDDALARARTATPARGPSIRATAYMPTDGEV